jgi:hypothetical protein
VTDKKRRPTRRRLQSELDDLRDDAGADGDDLTVTISHVDVPPADDDADDTDDAMLLHRRWSADPDVKDFDVDPDDVRDSTDDEDDGGIPAGKPTYD